MAKNTKRTPLGEKLYQTRKKSHITQVQMSELLNIKRGTYARYETNTTPPIKILTKIGQILGLTTDDLLSENKTYAEIINENRNQLILLSSEHSYNKPQNNSNGFTNEELDVLIKIINLPQDKRDELVAYISEVINENSDESN